MKSEVGKALFAALQQHVGNCLRAIDRLEFDRARAVAEEAQAIVRQRQDDPSIEDEHILNDFAVLIYLIQLLSEYTTFWERVTKREYEPSWMTLQDLLDLIRVLKRISLIDVCQFERQLGQLENAYPYTLFASVGCIAERVECSICGHDIDSFECVHRRGQLYRGKMAYGIVREMKKFDHVALTESPKDKRCIVKLAEKEYEFPALDWLASHLRAKRICVSDFSHIEMSKRRKRSDSIVGQPRNAACQCGSGKKFKHCCGEKEFITLPHVKFILNGHCRGKVSESPIVAHLC